VFYTEYGICDVLGRYLNVDFICQIAIAVTKNFIGCFSKHEAKLYCLLEYYRICFATLQCLFTGLDENFAR
jgi:hypothetical protein